MSKMLEVTSQSLFTQDKISLKSLNGLGGKDLGVKVLLKETVLPSARDSGPDSQESQPSAESLSQLHSLIMCLGTAWFQGGESYYFQMFFLR